MIPVPQDILNDPDYYLTGKIIRKQVADIEFHVSVTEYQTPEYRSRSTGRRGHAPFPDGLNLLKRLQEYRDSHLLFLRHPEIQPTNNLSERALRKFKRKQHQAVAFRSNQSVEYLCDCMSVIETNRLYNTNIYKITQKVLSPG